MTAATVASDPKSVRVPEPLLDEASFFSDVARFASRDLERWAAAIKADVAQTCGGLAFPSAANVAVTSSGIYDCEFSTTKDAAMFVADSVAVVEASKVGSVNCVDGDGHQSSLSGGSVVVLGGAEGGASTTPTFDRSGIDAGTVRVSDKVVRCSNLVVSAAAAAFFVPARTITGGETVEQIAASFCGG